MTTLSTDFSPPPHDLASSVKPAQKPLRTFLAKTLSISVAVAIVTMGGICTSAYAAPASDVGKWFKAEQPIKDAQGRIRYIVTLEEDNATKATEKFKDVKEALDWKTARTTEYISTLIKSKGNEVIILSATSLTMPSFVAYLTEKQAKDIADDRRVVSMTEDRYSEVSSPWYNATDPSGQIRSWGLTAMNNASPAASTGSATVYILDTGVALHGDLPGLYSANQLQGSHISNGQAYGGILSPVGCWPHATHVAGIIGAADNSIDTVGMLPGVKIVSVALGDTNYNPSASYPTTNYTAVPYGNAGDCSGGASGIGSWTLAAMMNGLDYVYRQTTLNQNVGIVNLSLNGSDFAQSNGASAFRTQLQKVATGKWVYIGGQAGFWYAGSLIVQSAGNQYFDYFGPVWGSDSDACTAAYGPADPSDGIIVVGGLNNLGNKFTGEFYGGPTASSTMSSKDGDCVEMWAPAAKIRATFSPNWEGQTTHELTGTSMSAPFVSGMAAKILETTGATTAQQLEQAIRAKLVNTPYNYPMPKF